MFTSEFFNIGTIVFTQAVNNEVAENKQFAKDIVSAMKKYCLKDWGLVCKEDGKANDDALNYPDDLYLLGAYDTCKGKIYIITQRKSEIAGDNCTTVLFPDEY